MQALMQRPSRSGVSARQSRNDRDVTDTEEQRMADVIWVDGGANPKVQRCSGG